MAKFEGGIFSRARGKASGLVFSEANTRQGKRQTVRELVKPHDPGTERQILARQAQSDSSEIARLLNNSFEVNLPAITQSFYDAIYRKVVGQLSGFQSLKSVILSARNVSSSVIEFSETPVPTVAGNLHTPEVVEFSLLPSGNLFVEWSTELGLNGSANDTVITGAFSINPVQTLGGYLVNFDGNGEGRSNGEAVFSRPSESSDIDGWLQFFIVVSTSGTNVVNRSTYIYAQQPQMV